MTANGKARFGPEFPTYQMSDEEKVLCIDLNKQLDTISVQPPETTARNITDWTYRGRFMAGKEGEYDATLEAYRQITTSNPETHIKALENCRTYASLRRDFATGDVKVFGDSCRDRWCPMCAGQKSAYAKDQTKIYIESLKAPKFLTLTLRHNVNDLKSQIEFLQERFRALRARAYWRKNVFGGIWFLQVKRGSGSGCWHPHLHILLDSNRMEQGNLSDLWNQVTFGSPVLDIRYLHDQDAAVDYVARYTARPAMLKEQTPADRVEIIEALFGKRLCGTFGNAKLVTLTPPKIESDAEWDYVGSYDDIIERSEYCPLSKAILIAYNTGQALSDKVYTEFTGHPPGKIEIVIKPRKVDQQLLLDFYNS